MLEQGLAASRDYCSAENLLQNIVIVDYVRVFKILSQTKQKLL